MRYFLLLAATCGLSAAAPQLAPAPAGYEAPVVTGYFRPMFEVPAQEQESSDDVSLSTGTGAVVQTFPFYGKYSKREAKADPALVYSAYPYAAYGAYAYGSYPYAYGAYAYLG